MNTLESLAKKQEYHTLILETGKPLTGAMKLYTKLGFKIIENYGQYVDMPASICMAKELK